MKYVFLILSFLFCFSYVAAETSCPFGLENDPAPGQCGLYVDQNQNGFCDLSQSGESDHGSEGCSASIGDVGGDDLKTMSISQVADKFGIDINKLVSMVSQEVSIAVNADTLLGTLHDNNGLKMHKVKEIVENIQGEVKVNEVSQLSIDWSYTLQAMHPGFLILFVLMMVAIYFLVRKYNKLTVKILNIISYYILPIVALSWVIYVGYIVSSGMQVFSVGAQLGYAAMWLFFVIMIYKPICVLFGGKLSMCLPLRKQLGIAVFWLAFTHMLVYLLFWFNKSEGLLDFFPVFMFFSGLFSIIALFIGFITSNDYSMHKLKTNWKRVQMVAYPALLAAVIHVYFINEIRGTILIGLFVIYVVLKFFEWRKLYK